jgi:hypothetical protein
LLEGYYNPKDYTLEPDSNPPFEVNIRVDCLEYLWRLYAEKIKSKGVSLDEGWKIIFTCGSKRAGLNMILSTLIQDMNSLLPMNQEDLASFDSYLGEASSSIIYTDVIKMVFRNETPYLSNLNFKTLVSSLYIIDDEDILEAFKENTFNYFFDLRSPNQARPLLKMILEVAERPHDDIVNIAAMSDLLVNSVPAVGVLPSKEELIKIIWMAGYRRAAGMTWKGLLSSCYHLL